MKPSENVRAQAFEVGFDRKQAVLRGYWPRKRAGAWCSCAPSAAPSGWPTSLIREGFSAAMIHGGRSASRNESRHLRDSSKGASAFWWRRIVASRGIHVEDIAHVINYDLPEIAENFIHRVGRTGRAGGHGVATTIITRDQRGELLQLERTLGIRIERLQMDSDPATIRAERPVAVNMRPATRMVRLPGEVFHA